MQSADDVASLWQPFLKGSLWFNRIDKSGVLDLWFKAAGAGQCRSVHGAGGSACCCFVCLDWHCCVC